MKSITPDRGKEFSKHSEITKALNGVPFYFPDPHAPWQRGTNEKPMVYSESIYQKKRDG
ncbi:hypothetical protein RV17_GL002065 [Enterococcus thailandicus]|nr:hypothetical protein RV17_GL002065 [Enterococcus thailandicus]